VTVLDDAPPSPPPPIEDEPRRIVMPLSKADRRFRRLALSAGSSTLVIMGLIALFLLWKGWEAFQVAGWSFFTTFEWSTNSEPPVFGVAAMMYGTFVVAVIALSVAVPVAVLTALFINEVAPRRVRRTLTALVDLLAAIPSIVYGLWGRDVLQDDLYGIFNWMADHLSFIPFFRTTSDTYSSSLFVAGLIVSIMAIPITTSVIREVFAQAPPLEREGALALGATRWGMIRTVILPFGRGGIVGGAMLGFGRALGETVAIAIVLSSTFTVPVHILEPGGATVAATIINEFGEASGLGISALMAAGLALFVVTLFVNLGANLIVSKSRSGAGVEI